jgi:uncharacterized membrane protein YdjX (TVP38/TMEM64 family)
VTTAKPGDRADSGRPSGPRRPSGPIRLALYVIRKVRHAVIPALLLLAVAVLWTATPLQDYVDAGRLRVAADSIRGSEWAVALVLLVYLGASPTMFPITLLNMIVAVMYAPAAAFTLALAGSMLNAGLSFPGASAGRGCAGSWARGWRVSAVSWAGAAFRWWSA